MKRFASVLVLVFAGWCGAAPPEVPKELRCEPGQLVRIPVKGAAEVGFQPAFTDEQAFFDELAPRGKERRFVFQAAKPGTFAVVFWTKGETAGTVCTITVGGAPPVPPAPDPKPKPPDPKPEPGGPFRVIFVYESSALLTPAQQQVIFGAKVREYLDANAKGWRRYDKDVDAANERDADIRALWAAAKPHVTTVPCVVIASGAKVEILALPAEEDAALELFKAYTAKGK